MSEFYGALAYAGYLKYKLKHSLILLTGRNIPISSLHKLHDKYNYKLWWINKLNNYGVC